MKKIAVFAMNKDKEAALTHIRALGTLHLESKSVTSPTLYDLLNRIRIIEKAESILNGFAQKTKRKTDDLATLAGMSFADDEINFVDYIVSQMETLSQLKEETLILQNEQKRIEKWGDFDPEELRQLSKYGISTYLYDISFDAYERNTADIPVIILARDSRNRTVRLIALEEIPNLKATPLPSKSLASVNDDINRNTDKMNAIKAELTAASSEKERLTVEKLTVNAQIEFEIAGGGMEMVGDDNLAVAYLSGYIPAADLDALVETAAVNHWALSAADPSEGDMAVPTKLVNNRFSVLARPILSFLDVIPGYWETDVSAFFVVFLALFFGVIFGDAGYGVVLLMIAIPFCFKMKAKGVPVFLKFMVLMGGSTVIWGIVSGTWFGLDPAVLPPFLANISVPLITGISAEAGWLEAYNETNYWIRSGLVKPQPSLTAHAAANEVNLQLFCFTVALIHLSLAHIERFIFAIKNRSLRFLASIGRLAMVVSMYFIVLAMIVYKTGFAGITTWQIYLLGSGFLLFFIFDNHKGSVAASLKTGSMDLISMILKVTGSFADIMSYIRLWAMILAGTSVAATINGFAMPMLGNITLLLVGVIIFVFGHVFNMVLNAMSFLVHGVRLNTLEFCSHVGVDWTGTEYAPFKNGTPFNNGTPFISAKEQSA
ncbi:MAG: hypothetical protein LBC96_05825 [Lachnospiraceae bacterium]|nr:hypothetical protein [Lachnospiraceae bacterium]